MKKIENISKGKIFDGGQELLKEELTFNIDGQEIVVKPLSLINNSIIELENIEGVDFFEIISESKLTLKEGLIKKYCNKDNLDVYFYKKDDFVMIFSFGEWQPSRYILNVESAWKV